ncbi:integrase catalytic subunit [Nitratireductor indicus C115]|uniref:Integrase catalytic subunit n=1 Tax=Nitratireductor indicus C115 TaxID=1231190 RepID=K2PMU5_9HYPH|nr:Mu transposase C-terminal domain-containing protein [Nitratireductor indicus]EKF42407.1 integrase catalytic subunit [Nitratireductor indicus C115]SFQ55683.1 putative transposase [Nitratireductor indicus]
MTSRFRLSETDCITINGADHLLQSQDDKGVVLWRIDDSAVRLSFTHEQLVGLLASPDIRFKRDHFSCGRAALRLRCDHQYLNTLPADTREDLLWKAAYCNAFLDAETRGTVCRTIDSIRSAMPRLSALVDSRETEWQVLDRKNLAGVTVRRRLPPSAWTLRNWTRRFEACGLSPLAFLRKRRSVLTYTRKFAAEADALLAECIAGYLSRNKPTVQEIVRDTHSRFKEENRRRIGVGLPSFQIPSGRTIHRRIRKFDPFHVVAHREGIDAAKRKFSFYENGIPASYPLERIEMDEWQVDVASLFGNSGALDALESSDRARFEIGRRWIYVAIDCATRCIVAFRLVANPSAEGAVRALELIALDKTAIAQAAGCESPWDFWGGIGSLVTDQGSAFASVEFRTAVTDLGATYEAPPAGVPKLRSTIERIFGTFGQQLAPMLTGRTFSNPSERGDYPSEQWAALTDDELAEIFINFIVDIYHNSPHAGLKGETPANAWKRLKAEQGATPPPDSNTRRVVFGIPLTRKLGRHGVLVHGISYNSPELQRALLTGQAREIQIRVDPHDLTHISVCLHAHWHPAEAVSKAVWGLSLSEWRETVRDLRTKHRDDAVLTEDMVQRARNRIRAIDQGARELRRVQPPTLTAADLERCERELFLGLRIKPGADPSDEELPQVDGLLGDAIGDQPASPPHDESQTPKPRDAKPWKLSDD